MNQHEKNGQAESPDRGRKRAYEPPRITYREALEAIAALCTGPPNPPKGDVISCPSGQLMS